LGGIGGFIGIEIKQLSPLAICLTNGSSDSRGSSGSMLAKAASTSAATTTITITTITTIIIAGTTTTITITISHPIRMIAGVLLQE
jgi:hypothetical protein